MTHAVRSLKLDAFANYLQNKDRGYGYAEAQKQFMPRIQCTYREVAGKARYEIRRADNNKRLTQRNAGAFL